MKLATWSRFAVCATSQLVLLACNGFLETGKTTPTGTPTLSYIGSFNSPTYITAIPGDTARLFVTEQGGAIKVLHHDTAQARPFLDLTGKISSGGERGLFSIAFDPQYATNGRFFVYFTDPNGDIRVVRYNVSSNPDSADPTTADTILAIPHPVNNNHNGGQLEFGPDNMLWIGTGDGGGTGDPDTNAQNTHRLLGKLLRLDVSGASGYAIPADNPFKSDTSGAPEVWSWGLRNPWRFSFDRTTGDLYIGDVGQDLYEEVDVATTGALRGKGANYGWNIMEGLHCYADTTCVETNLVLPQVEYLHAFGDCAITGGYVYRGSALPELQGVYFFADFCTGATRGFRYPGGQPADWSQLLRPGVDISSFGQDGRGELYIVQLSGPVWRIVPAP
ncbi:MAG TPA: PQQ-dependent sugar dehydrogenase [Gemmatimonadales bacterium]|nr:PQQ-dependent sugar dehydrogenase [Gemmatimonadales bacterium]